MARRSSGPIPNTRVVGVDGAIDSGALQRQLDRIVGHTDGLSSPAVSGLASADVDVIRAEADPQAAPGRAARLGSLLLRVRPDDGRAAYYLKSGPLDTDWDRLVPSGDRTMPMFPPYVSSIAGGVAIGNGQSFTSYIGRAPMDLTSVTVRWEATTAATGSSAATWAECAIATGPIVPGGDPVLTVVGYADIWTRVSGTLATVNSTVVPVREIPAGTDIWVIHGARAVTTSPQFRAMTGEALACGATARATVRPSTVVGRETTFLRWTTVATTPYVVLFT